MPVKQTWEERSGDPRAHAYRLFFELSRDIFDVLSRELIDECELDISWYDVLLHLIDECPEERMRMSDLAEAIVITRGGLTKLIDRMVSAGLVERIASSADRRTVEVVPTVEGERRFHEASIVHRRGITNYFIDRITEPEAQVLLGALGRVMSGLPVPARV